MQRIFAAAVAHASSEAAEVLLRSVEQESEEDEAVVAAAWAAEIERTGPPD